MAACRSNSASAAGAADLARSLPERQVAFLAVGFETTAPANAMAVWRAHQQGIENFSILCSHVLVPPAMEAILCAPDNMVQGFLAAGTTLPHPRWSEVVEGSTPVTDLKKGAIRSRGQPLHPYVVGVEHSLMTTGFGW